MVKKSNNGDKMNVGLQYLVEMSCLAEVCALRVRDKTQLLTAALFFLERLVTPGCVIYISIPAH